ncbi:MAG TPA: HAD family hydrolase [Candidatus Limnocylindria bacterium]
MPIRAVLFDLDNTLILEDESTLAAVRAAAALAHARARVDADAVANAAIETAERLWKTSSAFAHGEVFGIWWGEALWGAFAGDSPAAKTMRAFVPGFRAAVWRGALVAAGASDDALADDLSHEYIRVRRSGETIDPEAEPLLAALSRTYRLALVTNGAGDVQREKLSRTPLGRYFSAVVISLEVGAGKPDAGIFESALRALDVGPAEAVMVGDSLVRDVQGARNAGVRAIWIDRRLWDESGIVPDARISALRDLPAALDALERRPASPRATS